MTTAQLGGEILRTEGLSMRFGGLAALNNVSISVPRGEIRAVIGPNGAGKSTFFNCLTGVLTPSGGRITFEGADIAGLDRDVDVVERVEPSEPHGEALRAEQHGRGGAPAAGGRPTSPNATRSATISPGGATIGSARGSRA